VVDQSYMYTHVNNQMLVVIIWQPNAQCDKTRMTRPLSLFMKPAGSTSESMQLLAWNSMFQVEQLLWHVAMPRYAWNQLQSQVDFDHRVAFHATFVLYLQLHTFVSTDLHCCNEAIVFSEICMVCIV
jgi:hypothetical protein